MPFRFMPLSISDVLLIEPDVFGDERGFFLETYRSTDFSAAGVPELVQDNHSRSGHFVLRGLHYQLPRPQGKLVRVVAGAVFDVAVDVRQSSPTFGEWIGEILDAENKRQLWVPPGFAHGFLVLSEAAEVLYRTSDYYAPEHEHAVRWDDPQIAIEWPLDGGMPVLADRDAAAPLLSEATPFP